MSQRQKLQVLIAGRQSRFETVLAANIQCWGYDVEILPSWAALQGCETEGDIVLYDLDEPYRISEMLIGKEPSTKPKPLAEDFLRSAQEQWPSIRFTIALSSRSVSRKTLAKIGAVALLHKPFEMGKLQRYLHVLQSLLFQESRREENREGERLRILVADDNILIAEEVGRCLRQEPQYEVNVVYNGLEALERYITWLPHCIVTDLIMPFMNGYQVMQCIAAGSAHILPTFIVMSALTGLEGRAHHSDLDGKVVVYVNKPFDARHLLIAIEQAMNSARVTT